MSRSTFFFLLIFACFSFTFPAQAQERNENRLAFSVGGFDILDHDDPSFDLRAELRFAHKLCGIFLPWIGVEATTDGSLYFLGGLLWDYKFDNNWFVTPSLGAGVYKDGSGLRLGHTIEFRSQLEIGYEFKNEHRLSAAISHISNADLGENNPGAEVVGIYYSIPFGLWK